MKVGLVGGLGKEKEELFRLMAQTLDFLGCPMSRDCLVTESGVELHSPEATLLIELVESGRWGEIIETLHGRVGQGDGANLDLTSQLVKQVYEQEYFELLDQGDNGNALQCLRNNLRPLSSPEQLRCYAAAMLTLSERKAEPRKKLLVKLQAGLSPTLIPEDRLVNLIGQALILQASTCNFHNSPIGDLLLLPHHQCLNFSSQNVLTLTEHEEEVVCLKFSRDGTHMASSCCAGVLIIWEVHNINHFDLKHKMHVDERHPIFSMAWSPNDKMLLTCGMLQRVRRWEVHSGLCLKTYGSIDNVMSCAWSEDGKYIFVGSTDKYVRMLTLEGHILLDFPDKTGVGSLLHVVDTKFISVYSKDVLLIDTETKFEKMIKTDKIIADLSVSTNKTLVLLCFSGNTLRLYNISTGKHPMLVGEYESDCPRGRHSKCCLGGVGDAFIVGGSSDSQVYVFNRFSGELISTLSGHTGAVTCVNWNPAFHQMLATGSNDRTIRIWSLGGNQDQ